MNSTRPLIFLVFLLILFACNTSNQERLFTEKEIKIVPTPAQMKLGEGFFSFNKNTTLVVTSEEEENYISPLRNKLAQAAGLDLKVEKVAPSKNFVQFILDENFKGEAYQLEVLEDKISIKASTKAGFTYAVASLQQLFPVELESSKLLESVAWQVPVITIDDEPRFVWRGLMLDVSRHFFEKEYIFDVIDRMAYLKLNTFHFHLVDDQGWRIEIKEYPKLTEVGAWRVDHEDKHWDARPTPQLGEQATLGGFYTQEEIKEIVAYAGAKGINVVPEIEMPAHVMSAIAAYPELSCHGNEIMVPPGGVWPITDIYCPGKESTFEFLENVLLEVMELFPSKYIHVGGDEATKTNWKTCKNCQRRMAEEGLKDEKELQSYFIKRMERFISSHDRILIGWDEILEGGLAPGATVMSWRGTQGGWEASEQGHDVVMTPGSHVYFNFYQGVPDTEPVAFSGYTPLSKVYSFDPVVDSMSVAQKEHVLGGQANLWAEFITTNEQSEYMIFPRLVALSEVLWSPKEKLDWAGFSDRLKENILPRYDYQGINYARSSFSVTADTEVDLTSNVVKVKLQNEFPDSEIRYTLNGDDPGADSKIYQEPFELSKTTTIKAGVFENGKQKGQTFEKTFHFHKAVGKDVSYNPVYHDSYQGAKEVGMVNVIRGSLNFHDKQWQAWLVDDMEVVIDMQREVPVNKITVGSMENQGSGIYFPVKVEALISKNGKDYTSVGKIEREFSHSGIPQLKDFVLEFNEQETRYIKVKAANLGKTPRGGNAWLFVDEIIVE